MIEVQRAIGGEYVHLVPPKLREEAERLAGRPIDVVKVSKNKYVVEWFSFSNKPPEPQDTEELAVEAFIDHLKSFSDLPEVDPGIYVEEDTY